MKDIEAKRILSDLIGGFEGLSDSQVEWGCAIAAHFYNMGWLDGSMSERKLIELQKKYDEIDQESTAPAKDLANTSAGVPGQSFDPIAGIDFKTGVDGLFDSIKVICEDYNEKIRKEKP